MDPKIGDRVRYERLITRRNTPRGHTWQVHENTPGEGILMGFRYKQSGIMDSDYEEGWSTRPSSYWRERGARTKVALIAYDLWQDPRTVDPDGITVLTRSNILLHEVLTRLDRGIDVPERVKEDIRTYLSHHPIE